MARSSWYQLTGVHTTSGHINLWMVGQPRCCVGPTLPLLSLPHQTRVTAPCCTTTAMCHRPWVLAAPTTPPTPTRRAPGTPIDSCPVRTRGARRRTSPLRSGYASRCHIHSVCQCLYQDWPYIKLYNAYFFFCGATFDFCCCCVYRLLHLGSAAASLWQRTRSPSLRWSTTWDPEWEASQAAEQRCTAALTLMTRSRSVTKTAVPKTRAPLTDEWLTDRGPSQLPTSPSGINKQNLKAD